MTANEFLDLVRRSQLVEEDQLTKFLGGLSAKNGRQIPQDPNALAAAMVAGGLLTEWQCEKLLAGKHKGFMLGKYKLLRHLGKGGMSQVYLAEHVLMKRKVAIKVLPQNRVEDATYLERFRIEARAAARLDDPNIVRVYDIDQADNTHFIVMEYVEGQDLHVLVRDGGPLAYEKAADYVAQVARGLSHAHQMNLVHRDIKPANCLLDKHQTVKLLDMGLARLVDDEASLTLDNNENVLGTADYLAPEQALNSHKADARADIYSLGCTLYYLLTGHPPFPDGTISERLLKHQVEQAPSVFKDRPDAPSVLVNICNRMMAKRADERYQTAAEVAEKMAEWLADRGLNVGDSGKGKSGSGSGGVGSDVFRRFAASMSKAATESTHPGAKGGGRTLPSAPVKVMTEDDVKLAPLEEEAPAKPGLPKPAAAKAPVPAEKPAAAPQATATTEAAVAPRPKRSLIEEEFETGGTLASATRPVRPMNNDGFDPLRPPGYVGPNYGPSPWVYVGIVAGVLVVVGVVIAVIAGVI